MQPDNREETDRLIREAKAEGKDTSDLERMRLAEPTMGQVTRKPIRKGGRSGHHVVLSTGPAREEDFA